jgi:deoxyxylulose-5-phosphate synthase
MNYHQMQVISQVVKNIGHLSSKERELVLALHKTYKHGVDQIIRRILSIRK